MNEKLKDFERNGNHWLEPARQFILTAQQAKIIALQENPVAGRDFLKRIGSNRVLLSQKVAIEPKKSWQILYNLPADPRRGGGGKLATYNVAPHPERNPNAFSGNPRRMKPHRRRSLTFAAPQKNTLCSFRFARARFLLLLMKRVFFCGALL